MFTLITEILPVFLVVDGSFVKIFSAEHLETSLDDESALLGAHLSKDTIQNDTVVTSDATDVVGSAGMRLLESN